MEPAESTRTSRRTTRRRVVVEEPEDERENTMQGIEETADDEEFNPATRRSPRKSTTTRGKSAADSDAPAKTRTRIRKPRATESVNEPSEVFDPESTMQSPPASPSKRGSPRKSRKSVAPTKRSRDSDVSIIHALPTPEPSATPEPSTHPLSDITEQAVNEQVAPPPSQPEFVKVKPLDTVLERPMDIVVRTRALGVPEIQAPEEPKARTVIRYLILNNFKSYAGRQEVGPFHASFSSVVGPNGSGKSNVIDSLLFVFGFRASKMRQGKLSALIHNSAAHPNLEYCEVEVHFEEVMDLPGGKHEIIPDSKLVISRKAYKNNSSDYFMNERKSNFTAVTTLLREKGVDLDHKRFLILQGEVESIAQMKPKAQSEHDDGLLEYLEDIIGTSKYKTPIEEAAAETETSNEVCVEKSARVQHVEKEKKGLEDKKNKALAYLQDENELTLKQSALYQIYKEECTDNLQVTEEAIAQAQAALDEELGKHKGNEDTIKQLEKSYKQGLKEFGILEKETESIHKELTKCDKEKVKFDEKRRFLANKQKKSEKTLQTSRLAASEAHSLIGKFQDDVERCGQEVADLEAQMEQENEELAVIRDSLKGKTQAFSDAIAEKQQSLEPWNEKISTKQSSIAVARSELDMLRERASAGETAINEVKMRIARIAETRQNKVQQLEEAKAEKARLEKELERLQRDLAKLNGKEPELKEKLSGVRQKADEARASLSNTQSQSNVLNGLMRLKESGRIEGFHGRLGNLGTIDQQFDVAISTACPQLENMVADNVEVGQQCIDYLRKNKLGRANIICLDRLAKRDLSPVQTPEGVPRLFDLVKPKHDMFRPAFFNVLQNTLVADDLTQANRIAFGAKRWRVVTLDGQLIDISGTMTGGGTRVSKGAMSSKASSGTTKEQVSKLEVDRDQLEQQYQELQEQQQKLEIQARAASNGKPAAETSIQRLELELDSIDKTLVDSEARIKEISAEQKSSTADKGQMTKLEKEITKLEKELAGLKEQTSGVEEEIKELQNKIMEVGGVKLRMQKATVDGLKEQIDTLTKESSNAEVSKSKAEKDKAKHEKSVALAETDITSTSREVESIDSDGQTHQQTTNAIRQRAEEAQHAADVKKDQIEELKGELEERTSELNETRAVEIEMRNKLEENQKIFAENQKRLRYWTDKLDKLVLQSIEGLAEGEPEMPNEPPSYTRDELLDMSKDGLKAEIAALEEKTGNASVDLGVLDEYRRRAEEHASRFSDLQSAVSVRDAAKRRCDDLRRLRLEGFMQGFSSISLKLKEMYQLITMGGNAELELVDSLDPFSEGILFSVMPPKKSWKNISNLSGGEKTLSSLALVFALHHYRPTPLYVMDEIDAALDFRNVSIVASYIKERTKNAQFIVISLRNNMFELASRLVGVYKVNHMTKSVAVENKDYIVRRNAQ